MYLLFSSNNLIGTLSRSACNSLLLERPGLGEGNGCGQGLQGLCVFCICFSPQVPHDSSWEWTVALLCVGMTEFSAFPSQQQPSYGSVLDMRLCLKGWHCPCCSLTCQLFTAPFLKGLSVNREWTRFCRFNKTCPISLLPPCVHAWCHINEIYLNFLVLTLCIISKKNISLWY